MTLLTGVGWSSLLVSRSRTSLGIGGTGSPSSYLTGVLFGVLEGSFGRRFETPAPVGVGRWVSEDLRGPLDSRFAFATSKVGALFAGVPDVMAFACGVTRPLRRLVAWCFGTSAKTSASSFGTGGGGSAF